MITNSIFNDKENYKFINEKDVYAYVTLTLLGVLVMFLCDVFAYKTVNFVGYSMATSGLLFPISIFISDIISERWGVRQALIFMIYVTTLGIFANFLLWIISTIPGENAQNWTNVFGLNWRVIFSTLFGNSISFTFNAYAINFLKKSIYTISFAGIYFRDTFCNLFSKFLLVFIAYNITFYGIKSFSSIMTLVISTLIFKIIFGAILNILIPFILNILNRTIGA